MKQSLQSKRGGINDDEAVNHSGGEYGRGMVNEKDVPIVLDRIADIVLKYRPKEKKKKPRKRAKAEPKRRNGSEVYNSHQYYR